MRREEFAKQLNLILRGDAQRIKELEVEVHGLKNKLKSCNAALVNADAKLLELDKN